MTKLEVYENVLEALCLCQGLSGKEIEEKLYDVLVLIQNNWEMVLTENDDRNNVGIELNKIYDSLSLLLTDYEEDEVGIEELYNMLETIKNKWEFITNQCI